MDEKEVNDIYSFFYESCNPIHGDGALVNFFLNPLFLITTTVAIKF
jgi:hypothetical protein